MPFHDRDDGSVFYVKTTTTGLHRLSKKRNERPKDPLKTELLWGDRVRLLKNPDGTFKKQYNRYRARARGQYGWVNKSHLGKTSLLELYFIDVGQGDGVLIKTPDNRHILIDGGWPRKNQPMGRNASDFVDWKFIEDYESSSDSIEIDALVCSHNDQDHYGGLWDLLDPDQLKGGPKENFDAERVSVEALYHAGLSWWKTPAKKRFLGSEETVAGETFFTKLLGDRQSIVDGLKSGANPKLQGEWAQFLRKVKNAKTKAGAQTLVARLSHVTGTLPTFDGTGASSPVPDPTIHVLAPVDFNVNGKTGIRKFASRESQNTNGNSVLLRLDCGKVRVLLTGDLNANSQNSLLSDYAGETDVFDCDVGKACHHGSGDVSWTFLTKMAPRVTVISSGDSEGHDHPKPEIIAASAASAAFPEPDVVDDKLKTPLIYSTELARSVQAGRIQKIEQLDADGEPENELEPARLRATARVVLSGDRNAKSVERKLAGQRVVTKIVYGLINVRTDGETILCAALNEKDSTWNVKTVKPKNRP